MPPKKRGRSARPVRATRNIRPSKNKKRKRERSSEAEYIVLTSSSPSSGSIQSGPLSLSSSSSSVEEKKKKKKQKGKKTRQRPKKKAKKAALSSESSSYHPEEEPEKRGRSAPKKNTRSTRQPASQARSTKGDKGKTLGRRRSRAQVVDSRSDSSSSATSSGGSRASITSSSGATTSSSSHRRVSRKGSRTSERRPTAKRERRRAALEKLREDREGHVISDDESSSSDQLISALRTPERPEAKTRARGKGKGKANPKKAPAKRGKKAVVVVEDLQDESASDANDDSSSFERRNTFARGAVRNMRAEQRRQQQPIFDLAPPPRTPTRQRKRVAKGAPSEAKRVQARPQLRKAQSSSEDADESSSHDLSDFINDDSTSSAPTSERSDSSRGRPRRPPFLSRPRLEKTRAEVEALRRAAPRRRRRTRNQQDHSRTFKMLVDEGILGNAQDEREEFMLYVTYLIRCIANPSFEQETLHGNPNAFTQVVKRIEGTLRVPMTQIEAFAWKDDIKDLVQTHPDFELVACFEYQDQFETDKYEGLPIEERCDVCHRLFKESTKTYIARLTGRQYDGRKFWREMHLKNTHADRTGFEPADTEGKGRTVTLSPVCYRRLRTYHLIFHFKYQMWRALRKYLITLAHRLAILGLHAAEADTELSESSEEAANADLTQQEPWDLSDPQFLIRQSARYLLHRRGRENDIRSIASLTSDLAKRFDDLKRAGTDQEMRLTAEIFAKLEDINLERKYKPISGGVSREGQASSSYSYYESGDDKKKPARGANLGRSSSSRSDGPSGSGSGGGGESSSSEIVASRVGRRASQIIRDDDDS